MDFGISALLPYGEPWDAPCSRRAWWREAEEMVQTYSSSHSSSKRKKTRVLAPLHTCFCLVPGSQSLSRCLKEGLVFERHKFKELTKGKRPEAALSFRR